jgi:hypothetical protein
MICYEFWRVWLFFVNGVATLVFLIRLVNLSFARGRAKVKCGGIWWECKMSYFDLGCNRGVKCKIKE